MVHWSYVNLLLMSEQMNCLMQSNYLSRNWQ